MADKEIEALEQLLLTHSVAGFIHISKGIYVYEASSLVLFDLLIDSSLQRVQRRPIH